MAAENPELQSIRERLEKLERQNRWFKRAGIAALLLAAAVVVMGQARPSRTVTANKFVLQDSQGRARITIATSASMGTGIVGMPPDDPGIWIRGEEGQEQTVLTANALRFLDERGRMMVWLFAGSNGAGLEFYGRQNQKIGKYLFPVTRMDLSTWGLNFDDKDGTPAISLGGAMQSPEQAPDTAARELSFFDAKGKRGVDLGIDSQMAPYFSLLTPGGFPLVWMWGKGDSPQLGVAAPNGFQTIIGSTALVTPSTGETHRTSAASVVLLGKGGKVLWSAPPQ